MGNDTKEKPKNKFRLPIELAVNDDVAKKRSELIIPAGMNFISIHNICSLGLKLTMSNRSNQSI